MQMRKSLGTPSLTVSMASVITMLAICGCSQHGVPPTDGEPSPATEGVVMLRKEPSVEPLFAEPPVMAGSDMGTDGQVAMQEPQGEPSSPAEGPADVAHVPADAPDGNEATEGTGDANHQIEANIIQMTDASLIHGDLPADKVRYIVMHDTEAGTGSAPAIIRSWINSGNLVASHFVVERDGTTYQAVPTNRIAHHAGWSDYGIDRAFGISAERDDRRGYDGDEDYAMNAWSIGIEIVHEHDEGAYPEEQLEAVDALVAMIDEEVGHQPTIIDHKEWAKSRKQDCSDDFPLEAYKTGRNHRGLSS